MNTIKIGIIIEWYKLQESVEKLHDAGWKYSYFTSADISMLGYGYGVSQYPQFFVEDLDMYQVLPRPTAYLLMKMITISKNNWVIWITRKKWKITWYWLEK